MAIVPPLLRAGTRDLPDVPPFVQFLIGEFLAPILYWLESLVYRPLLRRCAEHPLVLLAQWYDPAAVVAACAGFHFQVLYVPKRDILQRAGAFHYVSA